MSDDHEAERVTILVAMERLLALEPTRDRPTVAALLRETGLKRWKLTHRHRDLNDSFLQRVNAKWGSASSESSLALENKKVRLQLERTRAELKESRLLVQAYAEIIDELRVLNDGLSQRRSARVTSIGRTESP